MQFEHSWQNYVLKLTTTCKSTVYTTVMKIVTSDQDPAIDLKDF
jgi:hypothetical protein